jgi:hypothetical protein
MNREQWLSDAVELMRPWFETHGYPVPEKLRVSVGWPRSSRKAIGQCWHKSAAKDGVGQVFISPVLDTSVSALDTLAHELVHAAIDPHPGHAGKFVTAMKALGLNGKPKSAGAGPLLMPLILDIAAKLGDYPHAALDPRDGIKKQSTRLLKVECSNCGYVCRVTRKWLDDAGAPICPTDHEPMTGEV